MMDWFISIISFIFACVVICNLALILFFIIFSFFNILVYKCSHCENKERYWEIYTNVREMWWSIFYITGIFTVLFTLLLLTSHTIAIFIS